MTKTKPDFNLSEHEMWQWDPMTNYLTDLLPDETFGICVKLSGGADSSIIYYRLCKEIAERNLNLEIQNHGLQIIPNVDLKTRHLRMSTTLC